jgi:hypothetical protein
MLGVQAKDKGAGKMRDMRNTPAGNPTVTEDYDDTASERYVMTWTSKDVLRIWDTHTKRVIWNSKVDEAAANLINAFGITIPKNPYVLPEEKTVIECFVVVVSDDEYHSHEEGPFWNKEDADKYAEGNEGWYGAKSMTFPKRISIYGQNPNA